MADGRDGLGGVGGSYYRDQESQLQNLSRVLRERKWIVFVAIVACVGGALALALTSEDEYEATSNLLFRDAGLSGAVAGATLFESSSDPQRDTATNVELVGSTVVADEVIDDLGLATTAEELLDEVTISSDENSDIVSITARDPSPVQAATIANAFAEQYVTYRRRVDREKVQQGQRLVEDRINDLPAGSVAERSELEEALRTLVLLESVQTGNAEVSDTARVPDSPVSPKPARDGILGLLFGLVLGIGLAMLLDLVDRRVKTIDDFERRYGLRVLASVPAAAFRSTGGGAGVESFRMLRSAIDYRAAWSPTQVLLVTSAAPNEGKTTVAVNLAKAMATGGQSVILVEADLRRPTLSAHFDLVGPSDGLSTALVREISLEAILLPSPLELLRILPSGPIPPNASELLRRPRMGEIIEELGQVADLVIIDSPPLLPVADTHTLLAVPQIDATVVVARAFQTTRQEITAARKVLAQGSFEALGLVICGTKDRLNSYYGAEGVKGSGHDQRVEAVSSWLDVSAEEPLKPPR